MSALANFEVGMPTLDRPFGVTLWPIFSAAWEKMFGYPAEKFQFVPGHTIMSTHKETVMSLIAYYIIILGGREVMRNRAAFSLNGPFKVHNLYLTIISGGLLALFIEQLLPTLVRNGVFYTICDLNGGWTDKLVLLYYVSAAKQHLKGEVANTNLPAELPDQVPRID
jgi:fatty acid elongase 3